MAEEGERSLAALGLDTVPALDPLSYPGRPVPGPVLLADGALVPLLPGGPRLGGWRTAPEGPTLDEALTARGLSPTGARCPVLAVGSNASPAQLTYKMARYAVPAVLPMVPVRVRGLAVGCSAHIGRAGYVAAAPCPDPAAEREFVVSWLDPAQLAVVDGTEFPNYTRALLPGDRFPMELPSGERLGGAYLYAGAHGVLPDPATGRPRPGGGDQSALLDALLADSPALRALLGPGPADWVARARSSPRARAQGSRLLAEEHEPLFRTAFAPWADDSARPRRYGELPPPEGESG
ncbi:hypothetical protein SLNWT_1893 [Streptomyces albus]|uniref:Uncharacterized protein n=1 Tax=Streptomyces albus (strain ATCC 21838 / DSM 41398 / FERM P-419 / JCM 4703 / NBRC 107858) TaxID=1081613 RepID=A0A0B5EL76_STRA4|nr:hypothetical protein SLNWT_1893 [Streptomyces albus]AOU76586.1 hypothetical protein SLNHY_1895 [Streptomyces albus]AYN32370.1 hypothetical protein DUI70_1867 [Streptomyces albus]